MSRAIRIAALVAVVVLGSILGGAWMFTRTGWVAPGLRVGITPVRADDVSAQLDALGARWLAREVHVDVGPRLEAAPRSELGARLDIEAMERRVRAFAHSGDPGRDVADLFDAWMGNAQLDWVDADVRVDRRALRAAVDRLAADVDRPARGASLDARGRIVELSQDGYRVDRTASVARMERALAEGGTSVSLIVERTSSGVGEHALPNTLHPSARPVVIARYTTRYGTRGAERSRAHNVQTAAGYLDGATVAPFGRLSFNRRVGARSRDRGYRTAHVIVDGEMVDGLGGGVCQVASTLHAAAFLSGFSIVDHSPHSRPSAYIPMGLDATVVWPDVDLVIENNNPFELTVRARARRGEMTVELLGTRTGREVSWERSVLSTEPHGDRYVEDPTVSDGEERVSQRGIRGYLVLRERTIRDRRGIHVEERRIRYPPTDRVIRVPPGAIPTAGAEEAAIPANPF